MTGKNPYTITFGKLPIQYISRLAQTDEIISSFTAEEPSKQVYIITGIRGSGKTVMMSEVSRKIEENPEWIVVELNPESDLLTSLGAKLYGHEKLAGLFDNLSINLSLFGVGVEVSKQTNIIDIETAVDKLLGTIKKKKKRVLITIDEVKNNPNIRKFISAFQIYIRHDHPVCLLMTGLYENVSELQNSDTLTFLYRAPKCVLKPLNLTAIVNNYMKVFDIQRDSAKEMADMTMGYSFGFQILGYLTYENGGNYAAVVEEYKQYLYEYVYEKVWSELSKRDKEIAYAIANCKDGQIINIRKELGIESNEFNPYRNRLIKKGVINGETRGYVSFTLPYFGEFVLDYVVG